MTDLTAPTKLGFDDPELEAARERATGDTEHSTRAYKAMARAQQMRPGLQAFARALTGEPTLTLKIWGGPASCTDGEEILISPPMELGNDVRHTRTLCNDYDELGLPRCPGCRASEKVLRAAEHEIGHITQGSFSKSEKRKLSWLLNHAAEWLEQRAQAEGFKPVRIDEWDEDGNPIYRCRTAEEWRKEITNAIRRAPNPMMVYLNCAIAINPWLKVLWNGLEDGRVNNGIHRARPGSRRYFRGGYLEMLERGILLPDGTWLRYSDREIESQLAMAVTFASMGYGFDLTDHFDSEVIEILADPKVRDVIERAATAEGVADTFNLARDLLGHLQGHGYMADPPPPELPSLGDPSEDGSDDSGASSERSEQHSERTDSDTQQPRDSEREDSDDAVNRTTSGPDEDSEQETEDGSGDSADEPTDGDHDGDTDPDDASGGEPEEPGPTPDTSEGAPSESDTEGDDEPGDGSSAEGDDPGIEDGDDGGSEDGAGSSETEDGDLDGEADAAGSESESDSDTAGSPDADEPGTGSDESSEADNADDAADCAGDEPSDSEDGTGLGLGGGSGSSDGQGSEEDDRVSEDSGSEDPDETVEPGPTAREVEQAARRAQADLDIATGHPGKDQDEDYGDPMLGDWLGSDDDDPDPEMPDAEENRISDEYGSDGSWGEGSEELEVAHTQHEFFRAPSKEVGRVNLLRLTETGRQDPAWRRDYVENTLTLWRYLNGDGGMYPFRYREAFAGIKDRELMDAVVQRCLNQARLVFTENQAIRRQRNLPYGRLATGAGPKLKTGNVKVFGRRTQPDSRDYAVLIGLDISGSTGNGILVEMKQAAYAQAELLHRLGIKFAFYCHTAMTSKGSNYRTVDLDLVEIKSFDEQWNDECRRRLDAAMSSGGNIDGHTLQTYRKLIEREQATDRLILYYTDGAMPLENYDEELEILRYECKLIERTPNLNVLAVGARTDSPKQHGLETVRLDSPDDLPSVVDALKRKLL